MIYSIRNNSWSKSAILFTIIAIVICLYSNTAFLHLHQLPNGLLIAHSHSTATPDNSSSQKQSHSHSEFEYLHFSIVAKIALLFAFIQIFVFHKLVSIYLSFFIQPFYYLLFIIKNYALRAPPAAFIH